MATIDEADLRRALREQFPELAPELDDAVRTGLVPLEVRCLAALTRAYVDRGDRWSVRAHFGSVRRCWIESLHPDQPT